jgi:hypothetical protein
VSPSEIIALLDIAMERKVLANFYCHLYEFPSRRSMAEFLRPVFACVGRNQQRGRIEARTMRAIVDISNRRVL